MKRIKSLNASELFQLALLAIENQKPYEAIGLLELSLQQRSDMDAYYLLAKEYVKVGMYDRATIGLQCILRLQSDYWPAYYQLGILHLLQDEVEPARQIWQALVAQCPAEDGLVLLTKGMLYLLDNDFVNAVRWLDESVNRKAAPPEFSTDALALLTRTKSYLSQQAAENRRVGDDFLKWQDVFYA